MTDERAVEKGLSITREHDGRGRVRTNGPSVQLSRTPVVVGRPAMTPGSAAADVLGDKSAPLVESGVVIAAD